MLAPAERAESESSLAVVRSEVNLSNNRGKQN